MKTKIKSLASALALLAVVFCVMALTACNLVNNICFHSWSEWTITSEATCTREGTGERQCSQCGQVDTSTLAMLKHVPNEDDGDCTTAITCLLCNEVIVEANEGHTGGTATCEQRATCEVCGTAYGEALEHILGEDDGDCTTEITCLLCNEVMVGASGSHTGGTATCEQKAKCEVCGMEYGEALGHISDEDDGDCTTAVTCLLCNAVMVEANESHTGGTAACDHKAECAVCGKEYGELLDHIPNEDDGDCTTAVTCSACGGVMVEANESHMGGMATCEHLAECEVCGQEYGELAEHEGEMIWIKHLYSHYLVYSCCYVQATEAAEHEKVDGVCIECGFNPTVTLTSTEITQGETEIEIVVSITDNPGITGLVATVKYSSGILELTNAENGEAFNALTFTAPSVLSSGCKFLWDGVEIKDEDIEDGAFLILTFNVAENAPAGEYTILLNISAYDNDLNPVNLIVAGGRVTIKNN